MTRDDFEKLANCANNNDMCRDEIFGNGSNPYTEANDPEFMGLLNTNLQGDANEADRIKLFYDLVCDDSKFHLKSKFTRSISRSYNKHL